MKLNEATPTSVTDIMRLAVHGWLGGAVNCAVNCAGSTGSRGSVGSPPSAARAADGAGVPTLPRPAARSAAAFDAVRAPPRRFVFAARRRSRSCTEHSNTRVCQPAAESL